MIRKLTVIGVMVLLVVGVSLAAHHSTEATLQDQQGEVHQQAAPHGETDVHHPQADHGEAAHGKGEEDGNEVMAYLAHHLVDSNEYNFPWGEVELPIIPVSIPSLGYPNGIHMTKHMFGLLIAGLLVIVLVIPGMARTRHGEVAKGFGNFLEMLVVFIRDEVVYPNMGKETGRKWLPVFLTAFFLILFSNLLGMFPWGTTPTGNVNMTAGLAISMLLCVFYGGIRQHGFKYLGTFVPHGVPWPVAILLFPIEIFGLFVKHFALCIRLFANMLAGHTVIGVFLALILSPFVALASVPGAVAISMLELFVAFLQSYIFVMLASLFVGSAIHPSH